MMKRIILIGIFVVVTIGTAAVIHWQLYLPVECRGDIPKSVPFHQGMTLCPRQSATFTIKQ